MKVTMSNAALLAMLAPTAALAHPLNIPHAHGGLLAGLLHPLTGADHFAAMVAVGLWAASLGGRALWAVPGSFVALLISGAVLGAVGVALPGIEPMIALSVVALGLAAALRLRAPLAAASALVGGFALFHGNAHGLEMPALANPFLFGSGFVLTTSLLHASGIALGVGFARLHANWAPRLAGQAIAGFGVVLLAAG